ncbi:hypothetical protein SAMN05518847_101860 [Paenibacillus sp. OV219]|nr:hypothetical protein SAMN05518847_101860 [Paenibacillus sp. OV219]
MCITINIGDESMRWDDFRCSDCRQVYSLLQPEGDEVEEPRCPCCSSEYFVIVDSTVSRSGLSPFREKEAESHCLNKYHNSVTELVDENVALKSSLLLIHKLCQTGRAWSTEAKVYKIANDVLGK